MITETSRGEFRRCAVLVIRERDRFMEEVINTAVVSVLAM